ncbi:MAG TPA: L,D-transpeptidase family protein [Steroidobacteraceae bacterium]|nr:L,D-transpeptidase family protein [Steroidobacteraceae bacterium]
MKANTSFFGRSRIGCLFRATLLCACGLSAHAQPPQPADAVVEAVRQRIDDLSTSGQSTVEGERLIAAQALPAVYQLHGYQPFWDAPRIASLINAIHGSAADGLTPADYHLAALEKLAGAIDGTPLRTAQLDLLATDAYTVLLCHLYFGKADPVSIDSRWNFDTRQIEARDVPQFLLDALSRPDIASALNEARPDHWMYKNLVDALSAYRAIEKAGGWPTVADGPTLRRGVTDPRVPSLRHRLVASHDAAGDLAEGALFDEPLEAALKHFQARHFLPADGTAGAETRRELNVSVTQRIDQIRVNLERARWLLRHVPEEEFVVVDVAGFEVRYVRNHAVVWRGRAQVGKSYRQTPIFRSTIQEVVVNPTWTVPPGILGKDILPAVRRDPSYLQKRGLRVIDREGRDVDPSTIDFAKYTGANFPYMIRQDPGPANALGLVKIMFPNPYLVYLHDTPSRNLFESERRAFSSGCIRTERPFELVDLLLAPSGKWNRASIDAEVSSGKTRTIRLTKPVPVLLLYWTVDRNDRGEILFKPDAYGRDPKVLAAIDTPFASLRKPGR